MSANAAKYILKPLKANQPADGHIALTVDYGQVDDYFTQTAKKYDEDRTAYLSSCADDPELPTLSKNWQRSAGRLTGWAETWYILNKGNSGEQQSALEILDRITKESGIRLKNLQKHIEIQKEVLEEGQKKEKKIEKLADAEDNADWFFRSALKTQARFTDMFKSGKEYTPVVQKELIEAGKHFDRIKHKFPRGKLYSRAIIFPPARIPVGEPVPQTPEVFTRYRYLPPEAVEYDPELDELVIIPGYVSEDGLIDDKSVIWHPENQTVELGYRNGERVTWNFWKPKDTFDVMDPDSWVGEYRRRAKAEWKKTRDPGIFEPRPCEKEPAPYDRIPIQSSEPDQEFRAESSDVGLSP